MTSAVEKPAPELEPDAALVRQHLAGDRTAFATLYRRHARVIWRRLLRVLGNAAEAEDAVQSTFIEAHRSLEHYDVNRPFGAWLHGIAFNIAGRALAQKRRSRWLELVPSWLLDHQKDERPCTTEGDLILSEQASRIYDAMRELAPAKRLAFALHEIDGMGLSEIGECLCESPQAVWWRIESAKKEIRKRLARADAAEDARARRGGRP